MMMAKTVLPLREQVREVCRWTAECDVCRDHRVHVLAEVGPRGFLAWCDGWSADIRDVVELCLGCGRREILNPEQP